MSAERTVTLFSKTPDGQQIGAGKVIFSEGNAGSVVYGIVEGTVTMQVDGQTVETIHQGDIFGEGTIVHPKGLRRSTAIAQTDCQLIGLDKFCDRSDAELI